MRRRPRPQPNRRTPGSRARRRQSPGALPRSPPSFDSLREDVGANETLTRKIETVSRPLAGADLELTAAHGVSPNRGIRLGLVRERVELGEFQVEPAVRLRDSDPDALSFVTAGEPVELIRRELDPGWRRLPESERLEHVADRSAPAARVCQCREDEACLRHDQ